jgi:glutamate-1-semialdehyde 2,1-aminomutase
MPRSHERSALLFEEAQKLIPGGVNSPVRAFRGVGGNPIFMDRGDGSRIFDVDGNGYVDYVMSWGPLIFGHAPMHVREAITYAVSRGTSFGASTEREIDLARAIVDAVPSIDKVRLVNSGTEAVMSAVRVARGFTKRDKIIKFEGNYHGHSDGFLAQSGSGMLTLGLPDSAGVPASLTQDTITLPYNDVDTFMSAMDANKGEIACVMLEPVAGNMGVVLPRPGFLEALRERTLADGTVLLFDEVITGFRLSTGGAQEHYGVTPDLTTLGKIIGGGLPLAAYGGRVDIMDCVAPAGPVYQAGTLSGNPLAVAAGLAQISRLDSLKGRLYEELDRKITRLAEGVAEASAKHKIPVQINRVGSMMTVFFTDTPVVDYATAKTSNTQRFGLFFRELLERGIYIAPSQFEAAFVSTAHNESDLDATVAAVDQAFAVLAAAAG